MAGIAGVVRFTDRLGEPDLVLLSRMNQALAGLRDAGDDRAQDPDTSRHSEHVAMVQRVLRSTGPDQGQPLRREDLILAGDVRLDNRDQLLQQLGIGPGRDLTDLELIADAYRRWGEELGDRLLGDLALAIWDRRKHQLLLVRDPSGCRPLLFAHRGDRLWWASSPRALLVTPELRAEVTDEWLLAYLLAVPPAHLSPFVGTEVVAPGEVVVANRDQITRCYFWSPDQVRGIRFADDRDYEAALREALTEAVRCRLLPAGTGTVCAELSGGLDSSTVVCLADQLIGNAAVPAERLITYSMVYDRATGSDERHFIEIMARHLAERDSGPDRKRFASFQILEDSFPILTGLGDLRPQVPDFWALWPAAYLQSVHLMQRHGARVLLSGFGGDHLLLSSLEAPVHLGRRFLGLRWIGLIRELAHWSRHDRRPLPELAWRAVLRPLLLALRGSGSEQRSLALPWLGDRWRSDAGKLVEQLGRRHRRLMLPDQLVRCQAVQSAIADVSWAFDLVDSTGVTTCYPFLDRRLIELCLGVPCDQLVRPGEMRSLHRRAMQQTLPPAIAQRTDKRGPGEAMQRALRRAWPELTVLLDDARVCARGLVDRQRLRQSFDQARFGLCSNVSGLATVLQVELWLRSLEHW